MSDDTGGRSWWSTVPGMLTALAGLITAVGGLLTIMAQNGYLNGRPTGEQAPAVSQRAGPADKGVGAPSSPLTNHAVPATVVTSPAEIVGELKAQGFKGIVVTSKDGSVVSLRPDADMTGSAALPLNSGQQVQFDRLVRVDVEQPFDGSVRLTFVNGQQLDTKTGNYSLTGKNDLGPYRAFLEQMRRIDFLR